VNDELRRLLAAAAALEVATGVKVVVIGGIARGNWAQPRNTDDVDVIVDTNNLAPLIHAAGRVGLVAVPDEVAALAVADMTRLRLPEDADRTAHQRLARARTQLALGLCHGNRVQIQTA
jgi:hypothetical protein